MYAIRPRGGAAVRSLVILLVLAGALVAAGDAHAGTRSFQGTLRLGSHGKPTRNLQWLLTGAPPSRYSTIHPLRGRKPNGLYGKRTASAVAAAKWRLGYPAGQVNRAAGRVLVDVLLGRRKRPIGWIQTAAKRQARFAREEKAAKLSACQRRVVETAESQVGVREQPDGSNWGPQVANYQAVTGAYHAAWCASFAQWVLVHAGYGTVADRSAGVFYIAGWAHQRGLLRAQPRPGVLVLFLNSQGHMGIVERVVTQGRRQTGFVSIEGNSSNQVARRFHEFSRATVFVYLPHCSAAATITNPPSLVASVYQSTPFRIVGVLLLSLLAWFFPPPHRLIRRRKGAE